MPKMEDHRQLKEDIVNCLQDEANSVDSFVENIRNKDVVLFLGNTRSGKSTLVNYLLGTSLESIQIRRGEFKIRERDGSNGPTIGQGSLSFTTLPGVFQTGSGTTVFVDSPGFEDNRGIIQEIINALCFNQIKVARRLKFVLVFDIADIISDRVDNFISCFEQLQQLVRNYNILANSICAVFTKDFRDYTSEEISRLLFDKVINVDGLFNNDELVRNLANNPNLIGIFRMPRTAGDVNDEVNVNIVGALNVSDLVDVENCDVRIALSDNSRNALLQIYPEYTDTNYFDGQIVKVIERYKNYFDVDDYVFASYDEELDATSTALNLIANGVQSQIDEERGRLIDIQSSLNELLYDSISREFIVDFRFIVKMDLSNLLEDEHKNNILNNYTTSLSALHARISRLLEKILAEKNERHSNNIKFNISVGASALGAIPAVVGAGNLLNGAANFGRFGNMATSACRSAFVATEATIGATAATAAAGIGAAVVCIGIGASYVAYKEYYKKRTDARTAQNRN